MIFFIFFIVLVFSLIFGFEYIIFKRWKKKIQNPFWIKFFAFSYWGVVLSTKFLFLFLFFNRNHIYVVFDGFLKHIYYFYLSWSYAFFFGFFLWFTIIILYKTTRFLYKINSNSKKPTPQENLISRKSALTGLGSLLLDTIPFTGTGLNLLGIYYGSKEFQIFRKEIQIINLPKIFLGYRIVQISDLHIGSLIHQEYLKPTLEIIQSLKPNCIVVTGDILDNSTNYLNIVGWYFYRLNQICPVYAILGNHDHIDNPYLLIKTLRQTKTKVLVNEFDVIKRDKSQLYLIGLDYPMFSYKKRLKISEKFFDKIYHQIPNKDFPIIVLNHHPSEFEYLKNKNVDLVLCGHTHGGQILLSKDKNSPLSLGSNFLKYYIDYYQENQVQLYVNRGLGHWFPLRINCPPEITLLELV